MALHNALRLQKRQIAFGALLNPYNFVIKEINLRPLTMTIRINPSPKKGVNSAQTKRSTHRPKGVA